MSSKLHTFEPQEKYYFTSHFHVLLHPQVGWELLTPSKLWGPAQPTTLKVPPFGVYENSENHYNAYENNDKPSCACDSFENCCCPGSAVVGVEPAPFHNRQSVARAYDNLAFHRENGRTAFLCQSQTNSWCIVCMLVDAICWVRLPYNLRNWPYCSGYNHLHARTGELHHFFFFL